MHSSTYSFMHTSVHPYWGGRLAPAYVLSVCVSHDGHCTALPTIRMPEKAKWEKMQRQPFCLFSSVEVESISCARLVVAAALVLLSSCIGLVCWGEFVWVEIVPYLVISVFVFDPFLYIIFIFLKSSCRSRTITWSINN